MKIKVTQRDIDLGIKDMTDLHRCPVARALQKVGFKKAYVGLDKFYPDGITRKKLPVNAFMFIMNACNYSEHGADAADVPKPFSFVLSDKQFKKYLTKSGR